MSYKQKAQHIQPKSPRQDQLLRAISSDCPLVIASGSAGTGKAQPLDAKVLTPSGWRTMGSLVVGDVITASDGSSQKVTGVFPQGQRQVYRLTTHDGRSTEACGEHLWAADHANWWRSGQKVLTTLELRDYIATHKGYVRLPLFEGVEDSLGAEEGLAYVTGWVIGKKAWGYGGREWPRVIPDKLVQRWPNATLAGVLDASARVRKNREIEWSNKRGPNTEAVLEMVRRCGGIAKRSVTSSEMILWWKHPEQVFKSFRKARASGNRVATHAPRVQSIEPTRVTETQCISVSNPNRLYVTDDYIVTHNTYCAVNGGLNYYYQNRMSKIVLTRSNQPIGRSLGYFPGTVEEKLAPWLAPMLGELSNRMERGEFEVAMKRFIELQPLEAIRGRSYDDALILVDEAQNLSWDELRAVTTRVGLNSKMILMGDPSQRDTSTDSLSKFINLTKNSSYVSSVIFGHEDVIRSGLTKELLKLFQDDDEKHREAHRVAQRAPVGYPGIQDPSGYRLLQERATLYNGFSSTELS